jgi:hypothetical protein
MKKVKLVGMCYIDTPDFIDARVLERDGLGYMLDD